MYLALFSLSLFGGPRKYPKSLMDHSWCACGLIEIADRTAWMTERDQFTVISAEISRCVSKHALKNGQEAP